MSYRLPCKKKSENLAFAESGKHQLKQTSQVQLNSKRDRHILFEVEDWYDRQ